MGKPPEAQLVAELEAFLEGHRDLHALELALRERVTFAKPGQIGEVIIHSALPIVPLRKEHMLGVLRRALDGAMPPSEISQWAGAVILLDCFDLEGPGVDQDALSETVWDLASEGVRGQLSPARVRELINRVLDSAA